jgi:putative transcriptional regulator
MGVYPKTGSAICIALAVLMWAALAYAVPTPAPRKGMLLVASRDIADPRFRDSVVLLLEHGEAGTMGVIVNRASGIPSARALPEIKGLKGRDDELFFGGPVLPNVVIMLLRSDKEPPESGRVFGDVYYSASSVTLEQVLADGRSTRQLRLFFGHAGWAPGQLEAEIARGDWHLVPGDLDAVFAADPGKVWQRLIDRIAPRGLRVRRTAPGTGSARWGAQSRLLDTIS